VILACSKLPSWVGPGDTSKYQAINKKPVFVAVVAVAVVFLRSEQFEFQDYFISDGFLFFNHPTDGSGCCTAEAESPSKGIEDRKLDRFYHNLKTQ